MGIPIDARTPREAWRCHLEKLHEGKSSTPSLNNQDLLEPFQFDCLNFQHFSVYGTLLGRTYWGPQREWGSVTPWVPWGRGTEHRGFTLHSPPPPIHRPRPVTITPYSTMGCLKMLWFRFVNMKRFPACFLSGLIGLVVSYTQNAMFRFVQQNLSFVLLAAISRLVGTWKPHASQATTDNTSSGSDFGVGDNYNLCLWLKVKCISDVKFWIWSSEERCVVVINQVV